MNDWFFIMIHSFVFCKMRYASCIVPLQPMFHKKSYRIWSFVSTNSVEQSSTWTERQRL